MPSAFVSPSLTHSLSTSSFSADYGVRGFAQVASGAGQRRFLAMRTHRPSPSYRLVAWCTRIREVLGGRRRGGSATQLQAMCLYLDSPCLVSRAQTCVCACVPTAVRIGIRVEAQRRAARAAGIAGSLSIPEPEGRALGAADSSSPTSPAGRSRRTGSGGMQGIGAPFAPNA